ARVPMPPARRSASSAAASFRPVACSSPYLPSGVAAEVAAEREIEIHALHAAFALHAQQVHPRGMQHELLLLDCAQVARADAIARLRELQRALGVADSGREDGFALFRGELARQRILHVAEGLERRRHVLRDRLLLFRRAYFDLRLECAAAIDR